MKLSAAFSLLSDLRAAIIAAFGPTLRDGPVDIIPKGRTMAADVKARISRELEGHCGVIDTDAFLIHHFPVSHELIDAVYLKLENKHYDPKRGWLYAGKKIPKRSSKSNKEAHLYNPLISICEAIRIAATEVEPSDVGYSSHWFKSPDKAPSSSDVKAPLIRPDIFLLLGMLNEVKAWEEKLKKAKDTPKEFEALTMAWWRRVATVLEVKSDISKTVLDHINQLMGYLRQIFREQLDHMFVPGLLFTGTQLAVWIVDRSGAVGMAKSFDIHKEPKKFIQVILGCSTLPPERLGWDTTMKLWKQPNCIHSFSDQVTVHDYKAERNWVIEMSAASGGRVRERFLTVKALSIQAECMNGPATVVWAALKVDQNDNLASDDVSLQVPQIFVLKQCWRPITSKPEGQLYPPREQAVEHCIGQLYSYEDVKINRRVVTTQHFIRGGLKSQAPRSRTTPREEDEVKNMKGRKRARSESEEPRPLGKIYGVTILEGDDAYLFEPGKVAIEHRIFSRILLTKSFGTPIQFFSSLPELVRVCSDVLHAIEYLYFDRKTLHRDISVGNILICRGAGEGEARGCLIDMDCAKVVEAMKPTFLQSAKESSSSENAFCSSIREYQFHGRKLPSLVADAMAHLSDDDALESLQYLQNGIGPYIHQSQLSAELSPTDWGFLEDRKEVPDVAQHTPQTAKRSITLPFASPEILNENRLFPIQNIPNQPPHDIRHDIESLFWCMTYICITRDGPGGKRRQELHSDNQDHSELQMVNYTLFSAEAPVLWDNKKELFLNPTHYEEYIMPQFHEYFEPLKPLMKRWWDILQLAHRNPMLETIHLLLRKELQSTTNQLEKTKVSDSDAQRTEKVLQQRKEELITLSTLPTLTKESHLQ
ncbi:hypothetical protein H0H93_015062 [Arthromyces matolae]|nr:hypothetical protein H0H93_015062 [Arthromyces matolae]